MASRKNKNINKGAALLSFIFMLLFFVLIVRFGYIETTKHVEGKGLVKLAKQKWMANEDLQAERGTIYDSRGVPLAENVPAYTVTAVLSEDAKPNYVKDPEKTAEKLAPILHMKKSRLLDLLTKKAFQVELGPGGRRISYEKMEKIKQLDLPGIDFIPQSKRNYPNQEFASYVLGFTTRDPDTDKLKGVMGIEKELNQKLEGKNGSETYLSSRSGVKLPGGDEKKDPPQDGDNVYLTLDSHIQTYLNEAVSETDKKYDPKRIMAVVMDPKTGKILGMANRPSFNPNTRKIKNFKNDIISDPFEVGSVMKIFTLAAAVDSGVYNGNATYKSGTYDVGGGTINDWNNGQGWGTITFNEGLQRSSNVGFSILANKYIGFDRFYNYLMKFDFKEKTGIALPDEKNSIFQYDVPIEKTTTAFGQGTAVTAMQLVKAATAIANDGKMMKPYIIDQIVNPNTGKVISKTEPKVAGTPISAESAKKVRDLLRTVVTGKYGTGRDFAIKGYEVAGKTGTAQIPKKDGSGYMSGPKYIHSFLGMAPKDDPKLLVYVAVDRPDVKTMHEGEKPVADIFDFVMEHSLQYLDITPDQKPHHTNVDRSVNVGDYRGQSAEAVKQSLKEKGLNPVVLGSGDTISAQMPFSGETVLPGERVFLRTNGKTKMPDLSGWSLADVMKFADLLGLHPNIEGLGYAVDQDISPGKPVRKGEILTVKLAKPAVPENGEKKKP
jgi:penicillin-binding protein 2B